MNPDYSPCFAGSPGADLWSVVSLTDKDFFRLLWRKQIRMQALPESIKMW